MLITLLPKKTNRKKGKGTNIIVIVIQNVIGNDFVQKAASSSIK